MSGRVLLLEDDASLKTVLSRALSSAGYDVRATASITTVLNWVRDRQGDLLVADVLLDGQSFLDNLDYVHRLQPDLPVIVMSAQTTASTAIGAERSGVFEYLPKPFDLDELIAVAKAALKRRTARPASKKTGDDTGFVGHSPAIQATFKALAKAGTSRAHTLITGEAGSGKRQAADAVLKARRRSGGKDVPAVLTPSHSAQAIFEACQNRKTAIWLRIDEWDEVQQRAAKDGLDTGQCRIVATASSAGEPSIDAGLRARLSECQVHIPPLRERLEDIEALAGVFLAGIAKRDGQAELSLPLAVVERLKVHDWPGNVTELRSLLSRLALDGRGRELGPADVETALAEQSGGSGTAGTLEVSAQTLAALALQHPDARQRAVDETDRALFTIAMRQSGDNRSKAAELLGINRNTLARRLKELGLDV